MSSYDTWKTTDPRDAVDPGVFLCEACQHHVATVHTYCVHCYEELEALHVQAKAEDVARWAERYGDNAAAALMRELAKRLEQLEAPRLFGPTRVVRK